MVFVSTRNKDIKKSLSEAIENGLAADGGLFVPSYFPRIDLSIFHENDTFSEFAFKLLSIFFKHDILSEYLNDFCQAAFNFPLIIKKIDSNTNCLELFHGPTLAFKDFGARFLAECLNKIADINKKKFTIIVATSGDTGSAVASAFYKKKNVDVIILFPKDKISLRQKKLLTCWDNNIFSISVNGRFDDCQSLVKSAFKHEWWTANKTLTTANSINIARMLPQMAYYAYSSLLHYRKNSSKTGFIIPSGNFGNAAGAYWAKEMGFPIREIVMPTNANKVLVDYLESGIYNPRESITTLANAMDVGKPSNLERIDNLFPRIGSLRKNVTSVSVNDEKIKETISRVYKKYKYIICPHTATGFYVRDMLPKNDWTIVATADPIKFETIVESIVEKKLEVKKHLQELLDRPCKYNEINQNMEELIKLNCKGGIKS